MMVGVMPRTGVSALAVAVIGLLCVSCSSGTPSAGEPRVESPDERLSDTEWDYGASVDPDTTDATFQPDVVIPEGGADTVVSVTGDGLTWVLDGGANGVDDLEVGNVLFLTSRAVGRVLGITEVDGDVAVTLGPVELTEIFSDIETSYSGELDTDLIQIRVAPERPSVVDELAQADAPPSEEGADDANPNGVDADSTTTSPPDTDVGLGLPTTGSSIAPIGFLGLPAAAVASKALPGQAPESVGNGVQEIARRGVLPPVSRVPMPSVPYPGLRTFPLHGSDGSWGVEMTYNRNGHKVRGAVRIYLQQPRISFGLLIRDSKIITAEAGIEGIAGLRYDFEAGTESGLAGNFRHIIDLPIDISVPVFAGGIPMAVNFNQSVLMNTAFSAKNSTLSFAGDYAFGGTLRAGYRDGAFSVTAPTGLKVNKSMLESASGVSVGVTGFVVAHRLRMTIGVGAFGFAVGPYVSLTSAAGVTIGSDLGMVKCKGATLNLDAGFGIGYVIPKAVAGLINSFLRALNLGEIERTGGTPEVKAHLATLSGYTPKANVCSGAI